MAATADNVYTQHNTRYRLFVPISGIRTKPAGKAAPEQLLSWF